MSSILWLLIVILVVLWLTGNILLPTIGGIIHILLVIALIVLIYQAFVYISGRGTRL